MTKTKSSRKRLSLGLQKSDDLVSSDLKGDEVNKDTKQSVVQSTGQPSLGELHIIHATSGRVRVRAIDESHNSKLDTICQSLHRRDGIKEVYVNEQTGSLVINFDEQRLSLSQVVELLQSFGVEQRLSSHHESKTDPFAAWKSPDFWKEQGISFIPLFAGLAVTRRLGIVGLAAFPVYFITANATRRVISYLESQFSAAEKSLSLNDKDNYSAVKFNKLDQSLLSKVEQAPIGTAAPSAKITYNVVHAIPGRIRFNVPRVARDRAYAKRLERLLKIDSHVTGVRVSCDAASVAITYGTSQIPVSYWADLMQLADETIPSTPPVKTPIEQQLPEPENQSTQPTLSIRKNEEGVLEVDGLWSDYKTPALSAALSFMANFPLDMVS